MLAFNGNSCSESWTYLKYVQINENLTASRPVKEDVNDKLTCVISVVMWHYVRLLLMTYHL